MTFSAQTCTHQYPTQHSKQYYRQFQYWCEYQTNFSCISNRRLFCCVLSLFLYACMLTTHYVLDSSLSHQILSAGFSSALVVAQSVWLLLEPCGSHECNDAEVRLCVPFSHKTHTLCPPFSFTARCTSMWLG